MPILELTSRARSDLRSAAHPLRPVVLIGDAGLTDAVLKEIDRALNSHELIKVRAGGEDRDAREAMLGAICEALSCAAVHHLGKTLILFRPSTATPEVSTGSADGKRRNNEPHTPKKLAAEGKTLDKNRPRKPAAEEKPRAVPLNEKGRALRPSTRKPQEAASHGIPRRAGSALSLRAGARSGSNSRGGLQRARVMRGK